MDVFKRLKARMANHADRRSPDQLKRGVAYQVFKFDQRRSDFVDKKTGEYPMNLVAYFTQDGTNYYVIMPTIYNNLSSEDFEELKKTATETQKPQIVYYGKEGARNHLELLPPGEEVDQEKLQKYLKIEGEAEAKKRKLNEVEASCS